MAKYSQQAKEAYLSYYKGGGKKKFGEWLKEHAARMAVPKAGVTATRQTVTKDDYSEIMKMSDRRKRR